VVADRLFALLSKPPKIDAPPQPEPPGITIAGQWDVTLDFGYNTARHKLMFEQDGAKLAGSHEGEFGAGDLHGTVAGHSVAFQSSLPTEGTRVSFQFSGTHEGGKLSGTVGLGEYGEARWTAARHDYSTTRRG
jgi:L-seryl-tRNA(Ser) seleniumtransferase